MRRLIARLKCWWYGHSIFVYENRKVRGPNGKLPKKYPGVRYFYKCERCGKRV